MPTINFPNVYSELIALLVIAVLLGIAATRLRQPLIIAFIAVGILVGPAALNCINQTEQIHVLAEMGLALLLFVVGLKLDPQLIRKMGTVSLATALGQMTFTAVVGYLLTRALGMEPVMGIYIAVSIVFSSTILIVKLLSDKRETDSLYGRISIGFLIVEDIVVVLAMIGLQAFTNGSTASPGMQLSMVAVKGIGLLVGVGLLSAFVLPRLLGALAHSAELLVLFGITWALFLAQVGDLLQLSKEVGAFLAGISLASTAYRDILGAKLTSLRDFLLLFFFIELGSHLNLNTIGPQLLVAVPLALLVLIGKPFIIMVIMGLMGYRKRISFMAGLTVAQISEFSLILISMGASAGHIGGDAVGIVTWVLLITMALSTHLIIHAQSLYDRFAPYLGIFERKSRHQEDANQAVLQDVPEGAVILIGLGSYGSNIGNHLINRGRRVLGVDFNPQAVSAWITRGEVAVFGDAEDPDFAHALPLSTARWVVSSIREAHINSAIVSALRHSGYRGNIALAAHNHIDLPAPLQEQADLVFVPFEDAAEQAVDMLITKEHKIERRAMDKLIESITDHFIVCGFGRMGQQIARDFQQQNVPFVVIEINPAQIPKLRELNIPFIEGQASEDKILNAAGIERAQGLIAVNPTDEENVFITLTARGLNPNLFIVARSILQENEDKLRRAGANKVVSPYILGGHRMAAAVLSPRAVEFLELVSRYDHVDTEIGDILISEESSLAGKTIRESGIRGESGVLILAIGRPSEPKVTNPSPETVIRAGDELIVMGTSSQVDAAERLAVGP